MIRRRLSVGPTAGLAAAAVTVSLVALASAAPQRPSPAASTAEAMAAAALLSPLATTTSSTTTTTSATASPSPTSSTSLLNVDATVSVAVATVGVSASVEPPAAVGVLPKGAVGYYRLDNYGPSTNDNVVQLWDEETLTAVRTSKFAPPVISRALAIVHTCMYDAWVPYTGGSTGTTATPAQLRRPKAERKDPYKQKAISFAAYKALVNLFGPSANFDAVLTAQGYNPAEVTSTDTTTPQGIANATCQAVLDYRAADGSNQAGNYADTTGYTSVNAPYDVASNAAPTPAQPYRWQPLITKLAPAGQKFAVPQWGQVKPFATDPATVQPPRFDPSTLPAEADQLLSYSAQLDDRKKSIAEYWADGPSTETPPGHWAMLTGAVSRIMHLGLDDSVKLYFTVTNAMFDAGIAAWSCKRADDSVRPITYIRRVKAGKDVLAWGGPQARRVTMIKGNTWLPYQTSDFVTPPFAEYVSGHSSFSGAAATALTSLVGDSFPVATVLSVTVKAGSSKIEPGTTPMADVKLIFTNVSSMADQAGLSRRYGGIHFESGDLAGRTLGQQVGNNTVAKARSLFG